MPMSRARLVAARPRMARASGPGALVALQWAMAGDADQGYVASTGRERRPLGCHHGPGMRSSHVWTGRRLHARPGQGRPRREGTRRGDPDRHRYARVHLLRRHVRRRPRGLGEPVGARSTPRQQTRHSPSGSRPTPSRRARHASRETSPGWSSLRVGPRARWFAASIFGIVTAAPPVPRSPSLTPRCTSPGFPPSLPIRPRSACGSVPSRSKRRSTPAASSRCGG